MNISLYNKLIWKSLIIVVGYGVDTFVCTCLNTIVIIDNSG